LIYSLEEKSLVSPSIARPSPAEPGRSVTHHAMLRPWSLKNSTATVQVAMETLHYLTVPLSALPSRTVPGHYKATQAAFKTCVATQPVQA